MSQPGRTEGPTDEHRPDLVGDGYDPEPLLTAKEVGERLSLPTRAVYDLPISKVVLGPRRLRWRPRDVEGFIERRTRGP